MYDPYMGNRVVRQRGKRLQAVVTLGAALRSESCDGIRRPDHWWLTKLCTV